ncbi:TadE/TadG family type IV pilus assembly protein [Geodermatophilus sp. SYSU D00758]
MPRLSLRRRLGEERGATAVMVAVLMVPLVGFAALAVDVAAVYSERVQLQSGADAAALAIGHDCAEGLASCAAYQSTAVDLTDANHDPDGSVHGTPVVDLDLAGREVTVTNPGTQNHWFAPVLGEDSTDVTASATVRWGGPGGGTAVLPLAFSWCAFELQTGGGVPSTEVEQVIHFTKTDEKNPQHPVPQVCTGPSNLEVPGGFAWLDTDPGTCGATTSVDGIAESSTGNSVPSDCTAAYLAGLVGETVLLPLFDDEGGTGANAWYQIYGYAAFTITGYDFGSPAYQVGPKACGYTGGGAGAVRCITGFFTKYVDSTDEFEYDPTAPDLGGRVVQLVA